MRSPTADVSDFSGASTTRRTIFIVGFFLAWTAFIFLSRYPGYVHFDTAEIFAWSTLGFEGGFAKHPPLIPWIVHAINFVLPKSWVTLVLLASLNVTLGIYGAWRVAALTIGEARAPLAAALYMLSGYTVWHGLKLNHNSILLSAWTLTVWAFLLSLRNPTWWRGAILGFAGAASIYAKYNSALLLVALFLASLVSAQRRDFYRSPAPYVAVAVFVALVAPHVLWEYAHNFQTVRHADNSLVAVGSVPRQLLLENIARLLPVLAVFALLVRWLGFSKPRGVAHWNELIVITAVPLILTLLITVSLGLRGSHSWTTPVHCFVPIVLAGLLARPDERQLSLLDRAFAIAFVVIPIIGAIKLVTDFRSGGDGATEPVPEMSRAAGEIWHATIGTPVAISGGEHRFAVGASLALADHPRSWSLFGRQWWVPPSLVDERGALGFCAPKDKNDKRCTGAAERLLADYNGWSCSITMHRTLYGMEGPSHTVRVYILPPRSFTKALTPEQRCPDAT
jgi:hypothetical protein